MLRWTVYLKGGPMTIYLAAVAARHKVYSFGGHCDVNKRDQIEVNIFNTVPLRWMKLPPVTTGRGELPLEVPSTRDGHTAVLIEDIIYIWGGVTYAGVYCNMLYAYDIDTHRWFKPKISGTAPEAMRNHSACVLGKFMYIFGGFVESFQNTIEIYKLDTTTMIWAYINTRDTPAPAPSYHSATIIGTKVFVFGGRRDSDQYKIYYNNISVFDTETNCWLSTPSVELIPEGRKGHSAFAYNGELYIFGGENLNRFFNDMWKFNPETFTWKRVELGPKGKGPRPSTSRMCCCMVGDCIILFGGYRYTPDELYMLDLSPSLKTLCKLAVIKSRLEHSGLPHNIRWELAAMTTTTASKRKHNSPLKRTNKRQRTH